MTEHRSRAERMRRPRAVDVLTAAAVEHGVCIRPLPYRRVDTSTGETTIVPIPCGATLEAKCPPCAERARILRIHQCREGWHLADEPIQDADTPTAGQKALIRLRAELVLLAEEAHAAGADPAEIEVEIAAVDAALAGEGIRGSLPATSSDGITPRRVRSTRRRQDAPDLPRLPVQDRTVGRTYTTESGRTFRPSLFLTLTLESYGPVHSSRRGRPCGCGQTHADTDPLLGVPLDPDTYDYRRAARDALHFPKLLDRFWQNLRRAVGWQVQYFGAVEPQRRLAPHAHFAVRGTIPRQLVRQVVAATYHQVWWPAHDQPIYDGRPPTWDDKTGGYVDPNTGEPLPTWKHALDQVDADEHVEPAHVVRFGPQVDVKGVLAGTPEAGRRIGYLAKYLTKNAADCHTLVADRAREHLDRLWQEIRYTPCAPTCANWLRYGVQPQDAKQGLHPGFCRGRAHRRETLGMAGRRVLVSRKWSGKTLADHKAERHEHVRTMLTAAGQDDDLLATADPERYRWELAVPSDGDVPPRRYLLMRMLAQRQRWRATYRHAIVLLNAERAVEAA